MASEALGFSVTTANVRSACKMTETTWKRSRRESNGRRKRGSLKPIVMMLKTIIEKLADYGWVFEVDKDFERLVELYQQ